MDELSVISAARVHVYHVLPCGEMLRQCPVGRAVAAVVGADRLCRRSEGPPGVAAAARLWPGAGS